MFLSSTVRSAVFATQGKNMITKASVLESLNTFENERRHLHRVFFTDREGTQPDQVSGSPKRCLDLMFLIFFLIFRCITTPAWIMALTLTELSR